MRGACAYLYITKYKYRHDSMFIWLNNIDVITIHCVIMNISKEKLMCTQHLPEEYGGIVKYSKKIYKNEKYCENVFVKEKCKKIKTL